MRASTNITLKDRNTLTLQDLKGVDFSSSPHRVAANRAADAVNVIYEDGEIKKRKGWQQKKETLNEKINGIFEVECETDTGDKYYKILIHAGEQIYVGAIDGTITYKISTDDMTIADERSSFFMNNGYCYIVCGDILVYGKFDNKYQLKRLADVDAYIPTTTINIDVDGTEDTQIAVLESPNVFTAWRKNTLVSQGVPQQKWTLDAKIEKDSDIQIVIEDSYDPSNSRVKGLNIVNVDYATLLEKNKFGEDSTFYNYRTEEGKVFLVGKDINEDGTLKTYGELYWGENYLMGLIHLYANWRPAIENEADITVTFKAANWEDKTSLITGCRFGKIFGTNGSSNRLFLSGNSSCPNRVFYSGYNDFTYFPDVNYINVGSETAKITGFCRLLDNTMAILKEKSLTDPTIYYMTGSQENKYDSSGELVEGKAVFYVEGGGIGEANINPHVTANLAGDALMLSENGVLGITLTQNMTTGARYVKERSYSINDRLRLYDLSDAAGIVFENKYYLSVGGVCFVADARHKYYREGNDMDQSYNYEWWYWDNVPARVWAVIDGKLWFGTDDGRVCAFDTEGYEDIEILKINSGELSISAGPDKTNTNLEYIVLSEELSEQIEDGMYIRALGLYADIFDEQTFNQNNIDDFGYFTVSEDHISRINVGTRLRFAYTDSDGFTEYFYGTVSDVDTVNCRFKTEYDSMLEMYAYSLYNEGIYNEDGEFELFEEINGLSVGENDTILIQYDLQFSEVRVINVSESYFQLEAPWGGVIKFSKFSLGTVARASAYRSYNRPVCAKWITPYFDMGSSMYGKTLLRLSVTAGEGSDTFMFGYETKRDSSMRPIHGTQSMDFNNFSFNAFSFNNNFASSHTVKTNVRNFNYIRFCLLSEDARPFSISSLQALYKINKMNRGVR